MSSHVRLIIISLTLAVAAAVVSYFMTVNAFNPRPTLNPPPVPTQMPDKVYGKDITCQNLGIMPTDPESFTPTGRYWPEIQQVIEAKSNDLNIHTWKISQVTRGEDCANRVTIYIEAARRNGYDIYAFWVRWDGEHWRFDNCTDFPVEHHEYLPLESAKS